MKQNFFDKITDSPKKTISVILIVVFVFVMILIIIKTTSTTVKGLINNIKVSTRDDLTQDTATYKKWAKKIKDAIAGWGTDEEAIYAVFRQIRSIGDYYSLENSYAEYGDLIDDLYADLDKHEITELNEILSKNNVNYSL